jgi:hypothetical protein
MAETDELAAARERLAGAAQSTYSTRGERAALRCALGDATALCDLLTAQIERENKGNGGKGAITKRGHELANVSRRCADIIFAMREMVSTGNELERLAARQTPDGQEE